MKRSLWPLLWIALCAFLVIRTGGRDRGVITDHLEFGRRLVAGEELYAPYLEAKPLHPVYPPSFGLLTYPFTLVDERAARWLWGLLQVGALVAIFAVLRQALVRERPELVPRFHAIVLLTVVVAARYVLRDTHGGGGNLINLAFALGALAAACASNRPVLAAVLLGVSLATKPTTVLLVPVLLALGRLRAAVGSVVVGGTLLGVALLVHGRGLEPLERWIDGSLAYGSMVDPFATPELGFPPFSWMNQCQRCALARFLGTTPPDLAAEVPGFVQGVGWAPATIAILHRVLAAAVVGLLLWTAWRVRERAGAWLHVGGAAFATGLLLSPISWKAHHVALLPVLFVTAAEALATDGEPRRRRAARGLLVGYLVVCTAAGGDLVGDGLKNLQQSLYVVTAGTVVFLAVALRRAAR